MIFQWYSLNGAINGVNSAKFVKKTIFQLLAEKESSGIGPPCPKKTMTLAQPERPKKKWKGGGSRIENLADKKKLFDCHQFYVISGRWCF